MTSVSRVKKAVSTISAGIQFAHIKTPLMKIIKNAHSLLDDVAKNETGRDSLAIRIHKPGGLHAQWSMPWQALLEKNELQTLITQLSQTDNPSLTNGWLMRAFDLFSVLTNKGELSEGITEQSLNALISQEYLHSGIVFSEQDKSKNKQLADGTIKDLLSICKKIKRISDAGENYQQQQVGYQADAIKVVRFLATKGVQD
jgi:CRISPR-associated protein Cmr2